MRYMAAHARPVELLGIPEHRFKRIYEESRTVQDSLDCVGDSLYCVWDSLNWFRIPWIDPGNPRANASTCPICLCQGWTINTICAIIDWESFYAILFMQTFSKFILSIKIFFLALKIETKHLTWHVDIFPAYVSGKLQRLGKIAT